jgi:hypothetical protein
MRAAWLAISLGLACGVLAREATQKTGNRAPPPKEDAPAASWTLMQGPIQGQVVQGEIGSADAEQAGVENRIVFVPFGESSPSMEEMRARLADPEQRKAMRAEYRTSLEQTYPDVDEVLKLDSATHGALIELLADQYLKSLDEMFSNSRREAFFSAQGMLEAENRKLDQLREILGDEGLERYQEYSVTVYERGQVREVDAHLGATDKLSPQQRTRLVKLFKERNQVPPPAPSRMPNLLRSHDPRSPTFREDMQRESELATIEGNEQMLWFRETSNRRMAERATEFLSPAQMAALAKVNEADQAKLRKWIEQARTKAGLDPAVAERQDDERTPSRKPASGEVTLDLVVRVNGGEPVHVVHTGRNGQPLKFKASEDLFAEAEWTLFDDNWIDVRLAYFEEGPNGLRRLQGGSSFGTMGMDSGVSAPGDSSIAARGSSSTIVTGRKAYSVELSASATAR